MRPTFDARAFMTSGDLLHDPLRNLYVSWNTKTTSRAAADVERGVATVALFTACGTLVLGERDFGGASHDDGLWRTMTTNACGDDDDDDHVGQRRRRR